MSRVWGGLRSALWSVIFLFSGTALLHAAALPAGPALPALPAEPPTEPLFGLGMTFNGFLVINTVGGRIATLDRRSLRLIDVSQTPETEEVFSNSFATSREAKGGAIYVASNRKMYRFVVDAGGGLPGSARRKLPPPIDCVKTRSLFANHDSIDR